ncbi:aryl-sulfate sulfotransferase [Desulfosediminicola ganghwensis]|uniref:aryl-sulfate sulfotransferase n=1 Tax=Desulfosediminicola ganghwensis TaxID=2569540 RepID=UPI0010AC1BD0|nr:aryl-sulfate sulfotransferase [Desulfosediminicola ganghwensis]
MTYPSIYPTGATIYNPDKCFNGYTVFQAKELGALVIDMNGGEIKLWRGLHGFPNKLLKGGQMLGHTGERSTLFGMQDYRDLIQVDWDGNVVWKFNEYEYIEDPGEQPQWMARVHHDYQRQGNPVGYYVPEMDAQVDGGNTLILGHKNLVCKNISDKNLLDDTIYEISWDGEILWEWVCSEHFEEFGFREDAKNALARDPNMRPCGGGMGDWMHLNSMSQLGPNKWYEAGDTRFHPDNIIVDGRETNLIFIISKETGKVVWKVGPYYDHTPEKDLEWIIGQHHAHMIPKGLPGEGNILVYDNGGWAGYGSCHPASPTGTKNVLRDYSRVLEFDPITLKIVWQYTPQEASLVHPTDSNRLYSPFISSAQRLPNGNTLITEGSGGRLIEITADHELVWEYISPYWGKSFNMNMVYRAYRYPYDYIPQVEVPEQVEIVPVDVKDFRLKGASPRGAKSETSVDGVVPYQTSPALCVLSDSDPE